MVIEFKFEIGDTVRFRFGVTRSIFYIVSRSYDDKGDCFVRTYGLRQTNVNGIDGAVAMQLLYVHEHEIERFGLAEDEGKKALMQ